MKDIKIYAVFDNKAEAFMEPFFTKNAGLALRAFEKNVQNPESVWNQHPNDFCLYEIGEYDEDTGKITSYDENKNLGMAVQYLTPELEAVQ